MAYLNNTRLNNTKVSGFTLLELVVVIILLGIIASVSTQFFTNTVIAYNDASIRSELSQLGRIAVNKLARELRNALPQSIRISGACIEFIPITTSASYQDQAITYTTPAVASAPLPVSGVTASASSFDVFNLDFTALSGTSYYIAVYPYGPGSGAGDPYAGLNPGPLFRYSSQTSVNSPTNTITRITISAARQFVRHSPTKRLFIVTQPVSYCVTSTLLNRHSLYGFSSSQSSPPSGTVQRVAENVQLTDSGAVTVFSYAAGSLVRNAVVSLDLRIVKVDHLGNNNWVRMKHEVQIRNVP